MHTAVQRRAEQGQTGATVPTQGEGYETTLTFVSWYSSNSCLMVLSSVAWRSNTSFDSDLLRVQDVKAGKSRRYRPRDGVNIDVVQIGEATRQRIGGGLQRELLLPDRTCRRGCYSANDTAVPRNNGRKQSNLRNTRTANERTVL